jgi:hypothetical protein
VAACVPYPITTVAIRDEHENAVRDFATALAIVKRGIDRFGGARWCAVEGGEFYANHSTVVEPIAGTRELKLYRAGDIPFPELLAASEMVPGLALEGPR